MSDGVISRGSAGARFSSVAWEALLLYFCAGGVLGCANDLSDLPAPPPCTTEGECLLPDLKLRRCDGAACSDRDAPREREQGTPGRERGAACEPDAVERCGDAVDNDCDGRVDEDPGVPCPLPAGACQGEGVLRCVDGAERCEGAPLEPLDEEAEERRCDGIDNDCDGATDEEALTEMISCGEGACAAVGERRCEAGEWVTDCAPGAPVSPDRCDGVDDDCDGQVDEDSPPAPISCGEGRCEARGLERCVAGALLQRCTPLDPPNLGEDQNDTRCDGLDGDCDGRVDEGFEERPLRCGLGACEREGVERCVAGQLEQSCRPLRGTPDDVCDGVDSDCDGRVDEAFIPQEVSCGVGACARRGSLSCAEGELLSDCSPGEGSLSDPCDGVDDDCDGRFDEDFVEEPIECGVGACREQGLLLCEGGQLTRSCLPSAPRDDDSCDGVDDDCDGLSDEEVSVGSTLCPADSCAIESENICLEEGFVNSCRPGGPIAGQDRRCDGIDEDCDGVLDEDVAAVPILCGEGLCRRSGLRRCLAGNLVEDCLPAPPAASDWRCDGLDEDCDGRIDEGVSSRRVRCGEGLCEAEGIERCVDGAIVSSCAPGEPALSDARCDGLDEDCDGRIDEDFEDEEISCGVGLCARDGQRSCEAGRVVERCEQGLAEPEDRRCDGLDEDCDGRSDEDAGEQQVRCGVGACASEGLLRCEEGSWRRSCEPLPPAADDRGCDGIDDDCDGRSDEDSAALEVACPAEACQESAPEICIFGRRQSSCQRLAPTESDDDCDGIDDDCDGRVDEDFTPREIECGVGACVQRGLLSCAAGRLNDSCQPLTPILEALDDQSCDGVDSDCDGRVDEGGGEWISCGVGACTQTLWAPCGAAPPECIPAAPGEERCGDELDNDCDGQTDEGFEARGQPCTVGVGACARSGHFRCDEMGGLRCDLLPGLPERERCDGLDNDCDGELDEFSIPPESSCVLPTGAGEGQALGLCVYGQLSCEEGESRCAVVFNARAERCDGLDEDCDGEVDEEILGVPCERGGEVGCRRCVGGRLLCEAGSCR